MNGQPIHPESSTRWRCSLANVVAVLCLAVLAGCREPELDTYYGHQQIPGLSASVNGTDVLASMFEQQGHKVLTRRTLISSQMASVDTIVWFPDDYAAPTAEVCDWFDEWLGERPGRTLVYVGRSFDAAPIYWRTVTPWVTAEQASEYRKRQREADNEAHPPTVPDPDSLDCEWFALKPKEATAVKQLAGDWSEDISAGETQLVLQWRLEPHDQSKPLLATQNDVLVARLHQLHWPDSQLLLVANGSFLLNLPLVNHEHRKLAGVLIASTGEKGKVVLLSSGKGGPPINPPPTDNSLWRVFGAWPLNVVLLHFAVLGVIFCFARWPIFGRPRTPPGKSLSDFGKHVEAVGRLLRRAGDRNYALEKLATGEETDAKSSRTATATAKPL